MRVESHVAIKMVAFMCKGNSHKGIYKIQLYQSQNTFEWLKLSTMQTILTIYAMVNKHFWLQLSSLKETQSILSNFMVIYFVEKLQ